MDIIGAGAAKPTGPKSEHVSDGSDRTFMADVMEPSKTVPVIVDFWAPWCGPCRTLGPIIEKAVDDAKGAVKLVKIDIDKNPGVAGQLGVQSIPAVIAFKGGRPVDGFMGAIPESQVKAFITKITGPGGAPADGQPTIPQLLGAANEALDAGDHAGAAEFFAGVLDQEETNVEAIAGLAKCYLMLGDHDRAREIAELIPADKRKQPVAAAIFSTLDLASHVAEPDEALELSIRVKNSPDDLDARFDYAGVLAAQGKNAEAVDHLIHILGKKLDWKENAAKEQLLKIFDAEGPKSEVTKEGRRKLSAILFR